MEGLRGTTSAGVGVGDLRGSLGSLNDDGLEDFCDILDDREGALWIA